MKIFYKIFIILILVIASLGLTVTSYAVDPTAGVMSALWNAMGIYNQASGMDLSQESENIANFANSVNEKVTSLKGNVLNWIFDHSLRKIFVRNEFVDDMNTEAENGFIFSISKQPFKDNPHSYSGSHVNRDSVIYPFRAGDYIAGWYFSGWFSSCSIEMYTPSYTVPALGGVGNVLTFHEPVSKSFITGQHVYFRVEAKYTASDNWSTFYQYDGSGSYNVNTYTLENVYAYRFYLSFTSGNTSSTSNQVKWFNNDELEWFNNPITSGNGYGVFAKTTYWSSLQSKLHDWYTSGDTTVQIDISPIYDALDEELGVGNYDDDDVLDKLVTDYFSGNPVYTLPVTYIDETFDNVVESPVDYVTSPTSPDVPTNPDEEPITKGWLQSLLERLARGLAGDEALPAESPVPSGSPHDPSNFNPDNILEQTEGFQFNNIWHYVHDFVLGLGASFSFFFGIWNNLPPMLLLALYSGVVVCIVVSFFKRFEK